MTPVNRQIVLKSMPQGQLQLGNFDRSEGVIPSPGPGQVLVKARCYSIDAAYRAHMHGGASYLKSLGRSQVAEGFAVGEVLESKVSHLKVGDVVGCWTGWQDFAAVDAADLHPLPTDQPLSLLLSLYGHSGLTAYHGLLKVGRAKAGDTVLVSSAAGAVGTIVGQIARLKGCRTIGITGSPHKAPRLRDEFGYDQVIDYKSPTFKNDLRAAAPDGVDVYFDNVGGDIFETVLFAMADFGRIVCCGALSQYDRDKPTSGPRGVPGMFVMKRLTVQGFLFYDYADEHERALSDMRQWVAEGKLKPAEETTHGFDLLPSALLSVLAGEGFGKCIVQPD